MLAADIVSEGPTLVVLHGVGTSRVIWRRALPALATRRRVIAPDLPGFGGSPPAGPGFALEAVADRLGDQLADAGVGRFDLLGNSLGGAVALVLADRRPDLVRSLILAAPAGFDPHAAPVAAVAGRGGAVLSAVRRVAGPPVAGSAVARRVLLFGVVADPARLPAPHTRLMLRSSAGSERIAQATSAVAAADLRPVLGRLGVPVGVLWGAEDRLLGPPSLERVRATVPAAPVEIIPRAGHVPHLERPEAFAAAVDRLLERLHGS